MDDTITPMLLLLGAVGILSEIGRRWVSSVSAKADIGVVQADRVNALHDRVAKVESSLRQCQADSAGQSTETLEKLHALDKTVASLASADAVAMLRTEMATLSANMANLIGKIGELEKRLTETQRGRK